MPTGTTPFEARLLDGGLCLPDLEAAREHATAQRMELAHAVASGVTSLEEINRVLAADEKETSPVRAGRRVLVCDDEPITRMLVKLLLEREPYVVLEASTGREGLDIARRERPDVMLIDLNMPEMDGYEAIGRIRRELTMTTMPIVVLTSEEGPGVERRVLDLGADDYILKPFDAAVLLARVQAVCRRIAAAVAA